jgi:hypothetical protein
MTGQLTLDPAANMDTLISDILMGRAGPWPLLGKQHELLGMLRDHKGARRARPLSDFVHKLHMSERDVKKTVKSLVEDFGLPIGASRQQPSGYFLCVTPEDMEDAIRPLVHEIESLARRVRVLGGEQRLAEIWGQMRLNAGARD